jgi:acyl-CoA reductase-like NAD-dependent aldehyde dehydrogenase
LECFQNCRDKLATNQFDTIVGVGNGTLPNAPALDHLTPDMRIYSEESFGPVAAIRIANESEFGLSASVFGQDVN